MARSLPLRTLPAARPGGASGWFADRRLAVKFGFVLGVVVLVFGSLLTALLTSNGSVRDANERLDRLATAQELVLQLDTRASELKVDGFKALVRPVPSEQLAELADDVATPTRLLAELAEVPLSGAPADAAAQVQATYVTYLDAISSFVEAAVADQAGARLQWEGIQAANDLTDGAVSEAKAALEAATTATQVELSAAITSADRTAVVVVGIGLVLVVGICLLTQRSLTRPIVRVEATLAAMATGDLTVESGVTSRDEVGRMAQSLAAAQQHLRTVLAGVAASADAVAASSEELSASSAQISASAEETSAQSGVVSAAAEEVSRNVGTVAAGA
ncbi:HAMP domain-containing protein, partial [Modestobacter lapidis]|nr:HAMP domain-containing protein [Modestobacter lapidis]